MQISYQKNRKIGTVLLSGEGGIEELHTRERKSNKQYTVSRCLFQLIVANIKEKKCVNEAFLH